MKKLLSIIIIISLLISCEKNEEELDISDSETINTYVELGSEIEDYGSGSFDFNPVYEKLIAPYNYNHFCQCNSSLFPNTCCLPTSYMIGKGLFRNISLNNTTLNPIITGMYTNASGATINNAYNYIANPNELGNQCVDKFFLNTHELAFQKIYEVIDSGYPLICLVNIKKYNGVWTLETQTQTTGHFVVIVGIRIESFSNRTGLIYYIDPMSPSRQIKADLASIFIASAKKASTADNGGNVNLLKIGCVSDAISNNYFGTNSTPIINIPSNNQIVNQNPINFYWENINNATQYRIQVATSLNNWSAQNGFQNGVVVDQNTTPNSYVWNNAQNNTTYYWSVKSIFSSGSSNYAQPYQFTVSNSTGNASINLSTSNISFGNTNVGVSSSQNFTITNTGNSPLIINSISSNNAAFSCNYSGTINAGLSQQVTANFTPSNSQNYSGLFTVNSNSTSGNNIINLSGTGVIVVSNSIINISPISLNFGNVNVGSSSSQNITIQNTGTAPLIVNYVSCANAYYFCNYSGTIPAGSSAQATVSFNPSSTGTLNSQLTVNSNATSGNNTISLFGAGTSTSSCNPIGNPSVGNYGNCESNSVVCNQARGIIKAKIINVNCTTHQITFEIKKCDATTFNSSGTFMITNGTCTATVYGTISFQAGQSTYQITINDNSMSGTKTYYALIDQTAGQSICPPIQISY